MRDLASIVQHQLSLIGRSGSTEYPHNSQDLVDIELHKLFVDNMALAFFKKQREETQRDVLSCVADGAEQRVVDLTNQYNMGQSDTLLNSENYSLLLKTAKSVTAVDTAKLRVALIKAGVDPRIVDECYTQASTTRAPAKTFSVILA